MAQNSQKKRLLKSRTLVFIALSALMLTLSSCTSKADFQAPSMYDELVNENKGYIPYDSKAVSCTVTTEGKLQVVYSGDLPVTYSNCRYEQGVDENGRECMLAIVYFRNDPSSERDDSITVTVSLETYKIAAVYYSDGYRVEGDERSATATEIATLIWKRDSNA